MNKTYEEFKQEHDIKEEKARYAAMIKANESYNQGLLKGLPWHKAWMYLILKKPLDPKNQEA